MSETGAPAAQVGQDARDGEVIKADQGSDSAYKVVFDEAVRAIEGQRSAVDEIRTRSGILLSATAIITGFLGPDALKQGAPWYFVAIAGGLLLLSVVPIVFVLKPTPGWAFSMGTRKILGGYVEAVPPSSMDELYRSLAWYLEDDWEANRKMLERRYLWFSWAAGALVGETIALLIAIVTR